MADAGLIKDTKSDSEFWIGVKDALPFLLSVLPYALVVGALADDKGFSMLEAVLQSAIFFAGASQVVSLELYGLQTPIWMIVLAIFAVNFRLVLYSAAYGRKLEPLRKRSMLVQLYLLQDLSFAMGMKRAETRRLTPSYCLGANSLYYITWVVGTAVGVVFGSFIDDPKSIGLDMLVPIYFLLLAMGFRNKPNSVKVFLTSVTMAVLAYVFLGTPYHIALGGLGGMIVAAAFAKPDNAKLESNEHA